MLIFYSFLLCYFIAMWDLQLFINADDEYDDNKCWYQEIKQSYFQRFVESTPTDPTTQISSRGMFIAAIILNQIPDDRYKYWPT